MQFNRDLLRHALGILFVVGFVAIVFTMATTLDNEADRIRMWIIIALFAAPIASICLGNDPPFKWMRLDIKRPARWITVTRQILSILFLGTLGFLIGAAPEYHNLTGGAVAMCLVAIVLALNALSEDPAFPWRGSAHPVKKVKKKERKGR